MAKQTKRTTAATMFPPYETSSEDEVNTEVTFISPPEAQTHPSHAGLIAQYLDTLAIRKPDEIAEELKAVNVLYEANQRMTESIAMQQQLTMFLTMCLDDPHIHIIHSLSMFVTQLGT